MNDIKTERTNPFFTPYDTLHNTVPFDKIKIEDYEEAFMEGIRRDDEEIDKIINNPEEPTFKTLLPLLTSRRARDIIHCSTGCRMYSSVCLVQSQMTRWRHWHRR